MTENEITYAVRGAVFAVHNELGPGLLESIYHKALVYELQKRGLKVESEVEVPVIYDGRVLCNDLRLDILVDDKVILELKSVETLLPIHKKQLSTYLKLTGKKIGLLINFNAPTMTGGAIIREANLL